MNWLKNELYSSKSNAYYSSYNWSLIDTLSFYDRKLLGEPNRPFWTRAFSNLENVSTGENTYDYWLGAIFILCKGVLSPFWTTHPPTYVRTFSLHRENCHFLDHPPKVIREKSCGEGSLIEQDTIENVSEPNFFLKLFKKKNIYFLVSFYAKNVFTV